MEFYASLSIPSFLSVIIPVEYTEAYNKTILVIVTKNIDISRASFGIWIFDRAFLSISPTIGTSIGTDIEFTLIDF